MSTWRVCCVACFFVCVCVASPCSTAAQRESGSLLSFSFQIKMVNCGVNIKSAQFDIQSPEGEYDLDMSLVKSKGMLVALMKVACHCLFAPPRCLLKKAATTWMMIMMIKAATTLQRDLLALPPLRLLFACDCSRSRSHQRSSLPPPPHSLCNPPPDSPALQPPPLTATANITVP